VWVPRLLLTLKVRNWLTTVAGTLIVNSGEAWPEIFLMFLQFGTLVFLLSRISLVESSVSLSWIHPVVRVAPPLATSSQSKFFIWNTCRQDLFFRVRGNKLTSLVEIYFLNISPVSSIGKTFPLLLRLLQPQLMSVIEQKPQLG